MITSAAMGETAQIKKSKAQKEKKPAPATTMAKAAGTQSSGTAKEGVGMAGQKVHIDPHTGKIKDPDPEDDKALSDTFRQTLKPAAPLQPVRLPNGALMVDLQEQVMDSTVVRRGPDGRLTMECISGLKNASEAVQNEKPQTPRKEPLDEK
jgi:hypothetical protein